MKTYYIVLFLLICSACSAPEPKAESQPKVSSNLEIYSVDSRERMLLYKADEHFEAPNWTKDNRIIFNKAGKLYSITFEDTNPVEINTGFATKCNNDHGISPDDSSIVVSHHKKESGKSMIYILSSKGGEPKQITEKGPSYWHGWSPAGDTLAYCAERNGEFDIYTISTQGGVEKRLTYAPGLDDGPDYTYDGKYIYFNSQRSGDMKIWRMKTDGSGQEQVTFDEYHDWFPHPSPDGKWLVFVSYYLNVSGHPANKDVLLRMMPLSGGKPEVVAELFGGQGTINVPSWSPDSKRFAFVSYKLIE